jgi:hypothetical protein
MRTKNRLFAEKIDYNRFSFGTKRSKSLFARTEALKSGRREILRENKLLTSQILGFYSWKLTEQKTQANFLEFPTGLLRFN